MMFLPIIVTLITTVSLTAAQYSVPAAPPGTTTPVLDAFMSYSIEFYFFPDYAGNDSVPNHFSDNLLNNIRDIIGTKSYIRVGGSTQDYALWNATLPTATLGIFTSPTADNPTTVSIGPAFFDSYNQLPGCKFSHGFNLGKTLNPYNNNSAGWNTLLATVPLACKALEVDNRYYIWEYGNEPDSLSKTMRPANWSEAVYVPDWLNGTREINALVREYCPGLVPAAGFMAPSLSSYFSSFKPEVIWEDGIATDHDVKIFSAHTYVNGAASAGVTLQGTLLNHTVTVQIIEAFTTIYGQVLSLNGAPIPMIFGETNSLWGEGKAGLSNTFGAALWAIDFYLYAASNNISRIHMHQGTDFRYASWQPVETNTTTKGTKAPYYGNIALASMIGDTTQVETVIANIPLANSTEAAYAAYVGTGRTLARILVVNMNTYNTTVDGAGLEPLANPPCRPRRTYTFRLPDGAVAATVARVQRLWALGSDAISGITWDGWSYNYELDEGKPVLLPNVTRGETVAIVDGMVTVKVPDSSAVMLSFV